MNTFRPALRFFGLLVASFALAASAATAVHADESDPARDLRVQLIDGLKATREGEIEFVDRVVLMVNENALPLPMVDSIYTYARNKHPRVPFPYFERALRLVAAQKGIVIE